LALVEQSGQVIRQRGIFGPQGEEPAAPLLGRHLQRAVEIGAHDLPALGSQGGHGSTPTGEVTVRRQAYIRNRSAGRCTHRRTSPLLGAMGQYRLTVLFPFVTQTLAPSKATPLGLG